MSLYNYHYLCPGYTVCGQQPSVDRCNINLSPELMGRKPGVPSTTMGSFYGSNLVQQIGTLQPLTDCSVPVQRSQSTTRTTPITGPPLQQRKRSVSFSSTISYQTLPPLGSNNHSFGDKTPPSMQTRSFGDKPPLSITPEDRSVIQELIWDINERLSHQNRQDLRIGEQERKYKQILERRFGLNGSLYDVISATQRYITAQGQSYAVNILEEVVGETSVLLQQYRYFLSIFECLQDLYRQFDTFVVKYPELKTQRPKDSGITVNSECINILQRLDNSIRYVIDVLTI